MTQQDIHPNAIKVKNRNVLILYLIGILFALGCAYSIIQYAIFSTQHQHTFLQKTQALEQCFNTTLEKYKIALSEFSKEIKKNHLFFDLNKLSGLFEKRYSYGIEDPNGEKVHISAINWVGPGGSPVIGRFGTLLYSLKFSSEYLKNLKKNAGNLEISTPELETSHSLSPTINFGIGLEDEIGIYRGFINVRVSTDALLERVAALSQETHIQVTLLNKDSRVLSSSIKPLSDDRSVMTHDKVNYAFTRSIPINEYPLSLFFGYSIRDFYREFFQYILPQLIGIMLFSAIIILFSYFYHLRKLKQGWGHFRKKIKDLNKFVHKMSEQNYQLMAKRKELEEDLKRREDAYREEKKFLLEVNKRISEATSDLLNAGNALLERVTYQEEIDDNPQEVMDIFEKAYFHACFTCAKNQESQIDVMSVIEDSIKIQSHKISSNNITIHKKFDKNVREILTDSLALKQVIVNILGRAIKNTPTEGRIEIAVLTKKDNLSIELRDNGYAPENNLLTAEEPRSLDCMLLEWHDLKKLARSLGGTLSCQYKPYKGNQFTFYLPYQFQSHSSLKEEISSPPGYNIIPFSSLEKTKNSKSKT